MYDEVQFTCLTWGVAVEQTRGSNPEVVAPAASRDVFCFH